MTGALSVAALGTLFAVFFLCEHVPYPGLLAFFQKYLQEKNKSPFFLPTIDMMLAKMCATNVIFHLSVDPMLRCGCWGHTALCRSLGRLTLSTPQAAGPKEAAPQGCCPCLTSQGALPTQQ